jgi:hypothetical protein
MENDMSPSRNQKQGVAISISDKIDLKPKLE